MRCALLTGFVGILLYWLPVLTFAEKAPECLRPFELPDQYGKLHRCEFKQQATVLLVADRDSHQDVDSWVSSLKEQYGSRVDLVGIADVSAVPPLLRSLVRNGIGKKFKHPILLDWNGKVLAQLPLSKKTTHVFLVIAGGGIIASAQGPADDKTVAKFRVEIDAALHRAGGQGKREGSIQAKPPSIAVTGQQNSF